MHIPDNYLSPQTCLVMTAAVAPVWAVSVKHVHSRLPKEKSAFMGVGAALSFLAMMFNIPLPGGTTGHAVGGTLIALLLGPEAACIALSTALLLQALLFGDGGILSFGANCFNMAFILPFTGYATACLISPDLRNRDLSSGRKNTARNLFAAGAGSYVGINAAALCAAIEFGVQPMLFRDSAGNALYCPYGLNISIPAMMAGHLTIFGAAEVIFTVAVYAFLVKVFRENSSDTVNKENKKYSRENREKMPLPVKILLIVLAAAVPLGLIAEGTAWGEWGTDEIKAAGAGYTPAGMKNGIDFHALLPDYSFKGLPDWTGYVLCAVIGAAVLIILFRLLASWAKSGNDYINKPET